MKSHIPCRDWQLFIGDNMKNPGSRARLQSKKKASWFPKKPFLINQTLANKSIVGYLRRRANPTKPKRLNIANTRLEGSGTAAVAGLGPPGR